MIDTPAVGCFQTAGRANSGVLIECLGFWLNACNQKHVNVAYNNR
jgi:hypothetical protein